MHRACAGLLRRASELSELDQHITKLGMYLKALGTKAEVRVRRLVGECWLHLLSRQATQCSPAVHEAWCVGWQRHEADHAAVALLNEALPVLQADQQGDTRPQIHLTVRTQARPTVVAPLLPVCKHEGGF